MLVNYRSSSSDSEEENRVIKKPKPCGTKTNDIIISSSSSSYSPKVLTVPPLPAGFHDIYTAGPKTVLNHALHHGRARVVAHVEGSWPSHVSLEWFPDASQVAALSALVKYVRGSCGVSTVVVDSSKTKKRKFTSSFSSSSSVLASNSMVLESLVLSDVGARLPLHLSLSDTLMVPRTIKEVYRSELYTVIKKFFHHTNNSHTSNNNSSDNSSNEEIKKGTITIKLDTTKAIVLINEARTRGFVALAVTNPQGKEQVRLHHSFFFFQKPRNGLLSFLFF